MATLRTLLMPMPKRLVHRLLAVALKEKESALLSLNGTLPIMTSGLVPLRTAAALWTCTRLFRFGALFFMTLRFGTCFRKVLLMEAMETFLILPTLKAATVTEILCRVTPKALLSECPPVATPALPTRIAPLLKCIPTPWPPLTGWPIAPQFMQEKCRAPVGPPTVKVQPLPTLAAVFFIIWPALLTLVME